MGTLVPLRELAEVSPGNGRYSVIHEGAQRLQQVTCNVQGRDVGRFCRGGASAKSRRRCLSRRGVSRSMAARRRPKQRRSTNCVVHSLLAGRGHRAAAGPVVRVRDGTCC